MPQLKNCIPWNKGKTGLKGHKPSKKNIEAMKKARKEKYPKGTRWKGNKAGYSSIHKTIAKYFGNPKKCENCKTTTAKIYQWANISGKYNREKSDWKRLCKTCHTTLDISLNRGQTLSKKENKKEYSPKCKCGKKTRAKNMCSSCYYKNREKQHIIN